MLRSDYKPQSQELKLETLTSQKTPKFKDHQIFTSKHQIRLNLDAYFNIYMLM